MANVTYFNRHESMDSRNRQMILHTINDLCICPLGHSAFTIENWLYGSFDGYDYSEIAIVSHELESVMQTDPELGIRIKEIFKMISKYPRTKEPNNNRF